MSFSPSVSVVIPAYNRAHTIAAALRSVLEQTYQDFEALVVDDGSDDDLARVVETFDEPRLRLIRHERNRGAAAARNSGIRAAGGEWVAFLDSDDEWLAEKLSEQMALLAASAGAQACTTGYLLAGPQGARPYLPQRAALSLKGLLLGCELGPGTTLVVRRRIFEEIGVLDETLPRYEDWDWLIRYAQRYPLALVEKPLARVNKSPRSSGKAIEQATLRLLEKHAGLLDDYGWRHRRRALARRWLEVALYYFREGNYRRGGLFFLKGIGCYPFHRPGYYLLFSDAIFGTRLGERALRLKRSWKNKTGS